MKTAALLLALAAAVAGALWLFLRKPVKGIDDGDDPRRGG